MTAMTDSPIQHVSDTAFWVATYRATESARADALFHDPLAARLVEGRGRAIADKMDNAALVGWAVTVRTCIIDDYIRAAVAAGADTVLNLGAGLDTRPYRMQLPPSLRWIEVDFADTIAFKEERLAGETPRCRLERVKLDLGDGAARKALFDAINAEAKRTFVITEGVVPYLSNAEVASLAADLFAESSFTSWMLEYSAPRARQMTRHLKHLRQLRSAPIQFWPEDWHGFFRAHGWSATQMRYLGKEGARRGRPAPLPWRLKLLMLIARLLPGARRRALEQMRGYAILEKIR
jgi:methyltransferase (TIGR00027 family)